MSDVLFWQLQTPGTHVVHSCAWISLKPMSYFIIVVFKNIWFNSISRNLFKFLNQDFSVDTEWNWKVKSWFNKMYWLHSFVRCLSALVAIKMKPWSKLKLNCLVNFCFHVSFGRMHTYYINKCVSSVVSFVLVPPLPLLVF